MYAAIRMRQPAQRVCLQLLVQHPMLLRPATRHVRTFQSSQSLRLDDTADKSPSENSSLPEAATESESKPNAKSHEPSLRDFESIFKNAAREDSFNTKTQAPSAWVTDDFGFEGGVPSYLDDASYQKPSAARRKKDRKKARREAYERDASEGQLNGDEPAWDKGFDVEFQQIISQKPTLERPSQSTEEPVSQNPEAEAETDNNLSPEELELKREFTSQRQDYERTKHEPITHRRSKHARPHRWSNSKNDARPYDKPNSPKRKKAWVFEMEKIVAKGLMFDAQGKPIQFDTDAKAEAGAAQEDASAQEKPQTEMETPAKTDNDPIDPIKELESIPHEAQMEDAAPHTFTLRNARHRISLKSEAIGSSMLGAPAQAIMMRNKYVPKRVEIPTQVAETQSLSVSELEQQIIDARKAASKQEVVENLHELCPAAPVVSFEDFMQLRTLIMDSFVESHLLEYIDAYYIKCTLNPTTQHMREPENINYSWIDGPVTWIPETVLEATQMANKERLVMNIMLRGWKLKIQEEEFGQGTINVKVHPGAVELLLSSKTALVPRLKSLLLNPNDGVRYNEANHILSITASHALSLTLLEKINDLASRMRGGVIPLELFGNRRLEPAEVRYLASITTSWINLTPERARVPAAMVGWIEDPNASPGIESIKHVVTRLIYSAVVPPAETTTDLVVQPASGESALMEAHGDRKQRNWKNRMSQWMRLVAPLERVKAEATTEGSEAVEATEATGVAEVTETTEATEVDEITEAIEATGLAEAVEVTEAAEATETTESSEASEAAEASEVAEVTEVTEVTEATETTVPEAVEVIEATEVAEAAPITPQPELPETLQNSLKWPIAAPTAPQDSASDWSPMTTRTTAIFGHLLHSKPANLASAFTAPSAPTLAPAFLAPVIPHIASLAHIPLNELGAPSTQSHTLIVHFSASPQSLPASFAAANLPPPKLELHLAVPADASQPLTWADSATRLTAIWATHHVNLMLPQATVDVQVTQQRTQTLSGAALHASAALQAFVDASTLDLSHGTLRTPPAVNLSLPLVSPDGAAVEPGPTDIQFLFMGLELRESFAADFHGHVLKHSLVEAGYHGGHRTEMALEPASDVDADANGDVDNSFLRTAYATAVGHYFPWHKKMAPTS